VISVFLFEETVEGVAGVTGITRRVLIRLGALAEARWRPGGRVARHSHAGRKQRAVIGFVFNRNSRRNRLQTLEARGRLEVRALFAAVKLGIALGTVPAEVDAIRQRRRATVASRRRYRLHQARQARASDVDGWAWPGLLRPVVTARFRVPVGIHVARLSVLSVAIHEACTTPYNSIV